MNGLIIGLACAGAAFILVSFFLPNKERRIEKELEELSMKMLQENYQIQKKLKIIEEELLIGDMSVIAPQRAVPVNEILINQVVSLHQQGIALPQIAAQSSLTLDQVKSILAEKKR